MKILTYSLSVFALASLAAQAATPLGGLTTAVSSDGSQVVAGGDTRTVLVLDPDTLEVKHREWIERPIVNMAFNRDGTVLVVQDTGDDLVFFQTSDWSKKTEVKKRVGFAYSTEADLVAGYDGKTSGATVYVHSLSDGAEKFSVTLPQELKISVLGVSRDGSKLAVLTDDLKDDTEQAVPRNEAPKDLRGAALEEYRQKNDGKTAMLLLYDIAKQEKISETKTYYTTNASAVLFFEGDDAVVVNYSNVNARISASGEAVVFQLENSFNYGIGLSLDQGSILSGGLSSFSITSSGDLAAVSGSADKLPGWPEYWKGFSAVKAGGDTYGATSAYRVFKMDATGKILVSEPVR